VRFVVETTATQNHDAKTLRLQNFSGRVLHCRKNGCYFLRTVLCPAPNLQLFFIEQNKADAGNNIGYKHLTLKLSK